MISAMSRYGAACWGGLNISAIFQALSKGTSFWGQNFAADNKSPAVNFQKPFTAVYT